MTADEVIARLSLKPHPEGGHYAETFRDGATRDGRPASTAIYYLLKRGERSHWHRIDAVEIWHFYSGDPLRLEIADDAGAREMILGRDMAKGERPQGVVPTRAFQAAQSLGEWTLVGCTVAPGFDFAGFELAPIGWSPRAPRESGDESATMILRHRRTCSGDPSGMDARDKPGHDLCLFPIYRPRI